MRLSPSLGRRAPMRRLKTVAAMLSVIPAGALGAHAGGTPPPVAPASNGVATSRPAGLASKVFTMAFDAAACAVRAGDVESPSTLTVIDYSKPSTDKRLWVFDASTRELLYEELVAHGEGTGENLAQRFSNEPGTHASSLGCS